MFWAWNSHSFSLNSLWVLESDVLGEQSCGTETGIVWISPVDIIYVPFCILVMHFIRALSWALTTYFCLNLKNSFLGYLTNNEWFLQFLRNYLINTNNWDEDERRDNWMSVFTNASASSLFPFTRRITEAKSRLDGSSGERMGAGKEEEGRRRREISRGWGWEELETVKWTVTLKSGTVGAELCKKDFQKTAVCFVI